jgi:protein O-GlcNAc transferase
MTLSQWLQTAMDHHQRGQNAEAEQIYRGILERIPDQPDALHLMGVLAGQQDRSEDAVELIGRAIAARPNLAPFHCNLGNALVAVGRIDDAIAAFEKSIALDPRYFPAHYTLAIALESLGRTDEAIAEYRRAIELNPQSVQAHNNLGIVLCATGKWDESEDELNEAFRLLPNSASVFTNLAMLHVYQGKIGQSIAEYDRALELEPPKSDRLSSKIATMHYDPRFDAMDILKEAKRFDELFGRSAGEIAPHENDRDGDRKLRIGYVSPDFCNHVVGRCMLRLLPHHDRERFEIHCYSNSAVEDSVSARLREKSDGWHSIAGVTDGDAAAMIRADRIDILIDLAVHTRGNRLPLFAYRPAPVQMTYLGCCSTTGLSAMDYRISDGGCDPPDTDLSIYSEKTIRLPRIHFCYDPLPEMPAVSPPPMVSAGYITFGCMNNFTKCSPAAIDLWIRILGKMPQSRLILHSRPGRHLEPVRARFEEAGISADRIEFISLTDWPGYFDAYRRMDVALDPFPYSGAITSCDTLWMGVPLITLSGKTAVGRMGAAILGAVGVPESIAETGEQYVRLAVDLVSDRDRLRTLRSELRPRLQNSPLMNAGELVRHLEASFLHAWQESAK